MHIVIQNSNIRTMRAAEDKPLFQKCFGIFFFSQSEAKQRPAGKKVAACLFYCGQYLAIIISHSRGRVVNRCLCPTQL